MTAEEDAPRPRSPWPGSSYATRHRWQLEDLRTLSEAVQRLRALSAELRAADAAGWWLTEPMRSGHLLAARASRRRRAQAPPVVADKVAAPPVLRWRVRLVNEPPLADDQVLALTTADRAPVFAAVSGALRQVAGPAVAASTAHELSRQVAPRDLGTRAWALAPARVGPSVDLVAEGSALRIHALRRGVLVRTAETLSFEHAADRAASLLDAAAAYERLARAAELMDAAGGRLVRVDDGFLHVAYRHS